MSRYVNRDGSWRESLPLPIERSKCRIGDSLLVIHSAIIPSKIRIVIEYAGDPLMMSDMNTLHDSGNTCEYCLKQTADIDFWTYRRRYSVCNQCRKEIISEYNNITCPGYAIVYGDYVYANDKYHKKTKYRWPNVPNELMSDSYRCFMRVNFPKYILMSLLNSLPESDVIMDCSLPKELIHYIVSLWV
jgi:hypothetical protein